MKYARLVFSSCEARLLDERARKNAELAHFNSDLVDQEGSILHTKSLEDRLRSIITEVNEEVDYWYYLLEPAYNRYLTSIKELR